MKVVKIPASVKVELPKLEKQMVTFVVEERSLQKFLEECFNMFEGFSQGHVSALLYVKLMSVLKNSEGAQELWFEDDDFKTVLKAAESARWLTPKINVAYSPFRQSLLDAKTELIPPNGSKS